MFSISLGRKQATVFGETLTISSIKSNTNFEENAKCSAHRASNEDTISFLNKNNTFKLSILSFDPVTQLHRIPYLISSCDTLILINVFIISFVIRLQTLIFSQNIDTEQIRINVCRIIDIITNLLLRFIFIIPLMYSKTYIQKLISNKCYIVINEKNMLRRTCATVLSGVRLRLFKKICTINSNNIARSGISLSGFSSKNFNNGNSSNDLVATKILGKYIISSSRKQRDIYGSDFGSKKKENYKI